MPALDVLEGERVRLRQPRADDAGAMFAGMASDPSVTRYLSWAPHLTVTETRRVILEEFNSGADPTWLVERADDGAFVGTCGWRWLEPHAVDLGYCLGRNWWGQGLATEAATLMVAAACSDPRVYRISAYCHVDNLASAAVLRRCGLVREGRLARYVVFPNLNPEPQDCLLYARAVR